MGLEESIDRVWRKSGLGAWGRRQIDQIGSVFNEGASVVQQIANVTPFLEDKVTVEVTGQPGHSKQQLYFLALATANGMVRRIPGVNLVNGAAPAYGALAIEYDAADNWVRCSIQYRWTLTSAAVTRGAEPGARAVAFFDTLAVYRGPQCKVVGGNFDFTNFSPAGPITIPGIPASAVAADGAPQLPFQGNPILTTCPTSEIPQPDAPFTETLESYPLKTGLQVGNSPNPKPVGDNRSRGAINSTAAASPPGAAVGTVPGVNGTIADPCCNTNLALIPLVFAALSAPATNADMRFSDPVAGPTGG